MPSNFMYEGIPLDTAFLRHEDFYVSNLLTWGNNDTGQLGFGDNESRSSPVQTITFGTDWVDVDVGTNHALALKQDGSLWVWGRGFEGQLGLGFATDYYYPTKHPSLNTWKQISAGTYSSAAIKEDNTLWVWGDNVYGQLGLGDLTKRHEPIQHSPISYNYKQVCMGWIFSGCIKTDNTLWLWGLNDSGQLGIGTSIPSSFTSSPIQTIFNTNNWDQLSLGYAHILATKTDGTLWVWGNNHAGQLGLGDRIVRMTPVQILIGEEIWNKLPKINAGVSGILKNDNTLWMWGNNLYGQLCTNDTENRSFPTQVVLGSTVWSYVSIGDSTIAIKPDGTIWGWGRNDHGQLGIGNTTYKSSPVQIVTEVNRWLKVSVDSIFSAGIATL